MNTTDYQAIRGGGKADGFVDKSLSCQGVCGGLATGLTGFCGCDNECDAYGDCCDDKATQCSTNNNTTVITESDNGSTRTITIGETIDVQLAGNPTTGYAWHLLASNRSFPLQNEEYIPDEPQLTGSGGTYHFYFTADTFSVGNTFKLNFAYYRSWEGEANAVKTFVVKIKVTPGKDKCLDLDKDYQDQLAKSQACVADSDCQAFVGGTLTCGIPTKAVNVAMEAQLKALSNQWSLTKCYQIDWNCPLLSPLPPYIETRGICDQGSCKVEYVDTRGAKEGDACGDDINVQCGEGLYCAFGLNWCGTPPVTGVCRKMGDCGAPSDCLNQNNDWVHPMCMGEATCNAGTCGWDCGINP